MLSSFRNSCYVVSSSRTHVPINICILHGSLCCWLYGSAFELIPLDVLSVKVKNLVLDALWLKFVGSHLFFNMHVHVLGLSSLAAMATFSEDPAEGIDEVELDLFSEDDEHRVFAEQFGIVPAAEESDEFPPFEMRYNSEASSVSSGALCQSALTPTRSPNSSSSSTSSPDSATTSTETHSSSTSLPPDNLDGYKRRRLFGKQNHSQNTTHLNSVDGFAFDMHPACKKYESCSTSRRSTIRKRVCQGKYRLLTDLKRLGIIQIEHNPPIVWAPGEKSERLASNTLDEQYFRKIAHDRTRHVEDRGYALWWLAQNSKDATNSTGSSQREMRIQGAPTVLLTYQDSTFVIEPQTVQLPAHSVCSGESSALEQLQCFRLPEVLRMLRDHPTVTKLRAGLRDLAVRTCNAIHMSKYSLSIELCTKTWREKAVLRVHAHLWLQLKMKTFHISEAVVCGSTPFINWTTLAYMAGASSRSMAASMAGSFYCCVPKLSTIVSETTAYAWVDYPVKDMWITSLYAAGKISSDVAEAGYLKTVSRAQQNISQLAFVEASRRKVAQQAAWELNESILRSKQKPWKPIPRVQQWRDQYSGFRSRYKFLVLDGPSSTGKTRYALDQYHIGQMLYTDCSMGIPNLREFDSDKHCAILFDELSPRAALTLKKCLQASNDTVQLGASPTMSHAYSLHLFKVAMVICCNNWQEQLVSLTTSEVEWLTTNCFYVAVDGPLWLDEPSGGESSTPP